MARKALMVSMTMGLASLIILHVYGDSIPSVGQFSGDDYRDQLRKMQALKASYLRRDLASLPPTYNSISPSPSPTYSALSSPDPQSPRVYHVTSYGADPTGKTDSTEAILKALSDAFQGPSDGFLMEGIANLGGARINLDGGNYMISRPLRFPAAGGGNLMIHGGTLKASNDFPTDGYLIDLSAPTTSNTNNKDNNKKQIPMNAQLSSSSSYNYEYVTIKDLLLNSSYRGGGISVINSLRISIDNCYITHFTTDGILVQSGHETYIRNSFLGQHITAGGDPGERNFSGTAINLMGNDNAITDVVIFSASVGVMVSGQANILTGVHCYNKATGFGGTGIYLKLAGKTQTRIVNSYLDYTGIVAEDPVQLHVSNCFFLGDAFILFKSINGVVDGVNVADNMFSGSDKGVAIVQLDQANGPFKQINQVVIDRNNVKGMSLKATVAKGYMQGNGSSWTVDLSQILLFPNLIKHVQYTVWTSSNLFPTHALRNMSDNRIVIESNVALQATVYVTVDQGRHFQLI